MADERQLTGSLYELFLPGRGSHAHCVHRMQARCDEIPLRAGAIAKAICGDTDPRRFAPASLGAGLGLVVDMHREYVDLVILVVTHRRGEVLQEA